MHGLSPPVAPAIRREGRWRRRPPLLVWQALLILRNRRGWRSRGASIDGTGQFAKGGAGTLILSGTNTYRGGTWLAAGTLSISSDADLGAASGALAIEGGATLRALADLDSARRITLGTRGGVLDSAAHAYEDRA